MDLLKFVGQSIRDFRMSFAQGKGLSQEALAKELGVTANTISRWETGTYRPDLSDLDKLARFFGKSILDFFPQEESNREDQVSVLLRTAKQLSAEDLEELNKYAEYRRARGILAKNKK